MSTSIARLKLLLLHRLPSRTDTFLTHLSRLLSTASGRDALLCTAFYTLAFTHAQLLRILSRKYENLAETIAQNASKSLLPGEAFVATIEPPHLQLTETCVAVKSLGDAIDEVRTFWRLRGLVDIYAAARENYLRPSRDPVLKSIVWAKILAQTGYQFYENAAYLVKKGVLRSERFAKRETGWWTVSSQFWFADVLLEFVRLARVRQLRWNEEFGAQQVEKEGVVEVKSKELEEKWWLQLYSNLGWFPNAVHWGWYDGSEESPMNETMIGLTGFVPGFINLRAAWEATA
ncbi:hypothetical protein CKM354_000997600 [Cercospora kikuchii]|uniref:Peroxin 11C n=1 Tax=Cercospora kikuchii TaxID=84275 RepID=A0A9P3CQ54_9PEZI|nr:uncharacterized protein CKM354_000997600 [Cercospora kikuchii]GIZ46868.1 hypothetical protein CKM354_000997600 [Cercospora kikuchii]